MAHGFSLCAMSSKPTGAKSTIISYVTYTYKHDWQSVYICSPEELMLKLKSCTSLVDISYKQGIIELVYMAYIWRNLMFDMWSLQMFCHSVSPQVCFLIITLTSMLQAVCMNKFCASIVHYLHRDCTFNQLNFPFWTELPGSGDGKTRIICP